MEDDPLKTGKDSSLGEKHSQRELEKRIFHLKTLYDLSQEIGYSRGTQEIIKNLLLMMIGTFGTPSGLLLLFDRSRGKIDAFTQRGLPRDAFDILSRKIESEGFQELNRISGAETCAEGNRDPKTETRPDPLPFFNLRIWIPFNIDANLKGCIGLGEKLSGEPYTPDDQELLTTMAHQGTVAVENANLHQAKIEALERSRKELEQLNKAKSRALDHLSHELRTPLSVVQGNIRLLKKKTQSRTPPLVREELYESLEKNLNRLSEIQQETDQIIRTYQELEKKPQPGNLPLRESLSLEPIQLYPFAEQILEHVKKQASHQSLHFVLDGHKDLEIYMDPKILEECLIGLVKNAVENTPEEGMIRITMEQKAQWVHLKVMDFGIGITKENQRHLFDGLFHTLDTELYSSKKPYDFGAGGKGLDLLRIKTYAQRYDFDISVGSQRCLHLPTDWDLCPGRISECPHCRTPEDCYQSGGSTFCLSFPLVE